MNIGVNEMEKISIFDFIGTENDDIYTRMRALKEGEQMNERGYIVRLTDKFYEIENNVEHLCFKTLEDCYKYLCNR